MLECTSASGRERNELPRAKRSPPRGGPSMDKEFVVRFDLPAPPDRPSSPRRHAGTVPEPDKSKPGPGSSDRLSQATLVADNRLSIAAARRPPAGRPASALCPRR